jgi:hypothetical protein
VLTKDAGETISIGHLLRSPGCVNTGTLFTLIVLAKLIVLLQLPLSTFVNVITASTVILDTVTSSVPVAGSVTGLAGVPVTPEYETISPAVPLMVKVPEEPLHTSPLLVIVGDVGTDLNETVTFCETLSQVVVEFFITTL